jgi:hypothetical protein
MDINGTQGGRASPPALGAQVTLILVLSIVVPATRSDFIVVFTVALPTDLPLAVKV